MAEHVENCEVISEITGGAVNPAIGSPLPFTIPCGGSYVAYESLFQRTRVTGTLHVERDTSVRSTCTLNVTVESAEHEPITLSIAPDANNPVINLTVDCLRKVTISCTPPDTEPPAGDFCPGAYSLQLRWCKCC